MNVVRNINLIRPASRNISLINMIVCLIISISTLKSYENVRRNMTVSFMKMSKVTQSRQSYLYNILYNT